MGAQWFAFRTFAAVRRAGDATMRYEACRNGLGRLIVSGGLAAPQALGERNESPQHGSPQHDAPPRRDCS
jgi:hypothetical protein